MSLSDAHAGTTPAARRVVPALHRAATYRPSRGKLWLGSVNDFMDRGRGTVKVERGENYFLWPARGRDDTAAPHVAASPPRKRSMKLRLLAVALAALTATAANAASQTIGFEGLGFIEIGSTYEGMTWTGAWGSNSWVVSPDNFGIFTGQDAHTGSEYAWSNGGTTLDLMAADGAKFNLDSMWTRGGNGSISFVATGYANGVAVYSQSFNEGTSYTLNTLSFNGIDKLELSNQTTNLLLDDITISTPSVVPEPASLAMLLAGLAALGATARRRKI
jgi:hypothetical protein